MRLFGFNASFLDVRIKDVCMGGMFRRLACRVDGLGFEGCVVLQ